MKDKTVKNPMEQTQPHADVEVNVFSLNLSKPYVNTEGDEATILKVSSPKLVYRLLTGCKCNVETTIEQFLSEWKVKQI